MYTFVLYTYIHISILKFGSNGTYYCFKSTAVVKTWLKNLQRHLTLVNLSVRDFRNKNLMR